MEKYYAQLTFMETGEIIERAYCPYENDDNDYEVVDITDMSHSVKEYICPN